MNADPFRPLPSREDYEADMRLTDERLEQFHLWTDPPRSRICWPCVATWAGVAVFGLVFWTLVAWGIVAGVM